MSLFFFIAHSKKAPLANSKSFVGHVSKNPYTLVLFQKGHCSSCSNILKIFDGIHEKYTGKVGMIAVDIDQANDIAEKYSIINVPTVALFSKTRMLNIYHNEISETSIESYCQQLVYPTTTYLNSSFDVFEFQSKEPANIVISDPNELTKVSEITQMIGTSAHVGVIQDQTLAASLGIEYAQIKRPVDNFVQNLTTIDPIEILQLSEPYIQYSEEDSKQIKIASTPFTLTAMIDINDPLHRLQSQQLFNSIKDRYEQNLTVQIADIFNYKYLIEQYGIVEVDRPIYILSSSMGVRIKNELFENTDPTPKDLKIWLDEKIKGIKSKEALDYEGIPIVYARQFRNIVLNPHIDVILLVAVPGTPGVEEGIKAIHVLKDLFKQYRTIKFYFFNPRIQLVPGLQLGNTNIAQISVWPANDMGGGTTFPAQLPLPHILQNVMRMINTKIPPTVMQEIGSRAAELFKKSDE